MWTESQQEAHRRAQRRDLGQGQVDEDHLPLDDVHAQVDVDAHEDDTSGERRCHELEHRAHGFYLSFRASNAAVKRPIQVSTSLS